jgi:hypothetical protein
MALGVSAVHLLKSWAAFSDSLTAEPTRRPGVAVLLEIGGALAFAVAGAQMRRRQARSVT